MAKLRAIENAEDVGGAVSIAVTGPEGRPIALERVDETGFIIPDTAIAKAGIADRKL